MLQEGTNRFSDTGRRRLVSPALAGRSEVNAGENQRQLGRAHFHRYCTVRDRGKLERAFLKSLVPNRQTIAIPVENLEAIAASIDEQEQVAGRWVLSKGGAHQAGECVEAFAKIGCWCVKNTRTA